MSIRDFLAFALAFQALPRRSIRVTKHVNKVASGHLLGLQQAGSRRAHAPAVTWGVVGTPSQLVAGGKRGMEIGNNKNPKQIRVFVCSDWVGRSAVVETISIFIGL